MNTNHVNPSQEFHSGLVQNLTPVSPAIAAAIEADFALSLKDSEGVILIRPGGKVVAANQATWTDLENSEIYWVGMVSKDGQQLRQNLREDANQSNPAASTAFAIYDGSESRLLRLYRGLAYEVFAGIPGNRVLGAITLGAIVAVTLAIATFIGLLFLQDGFAEDMLEPMAERYQLQNADR